MIFETEIMLTSEVCKKLRVEKTTIYKWIQLGLITPIVSVVNKGRGNGYKFEKKEIERFISEHPKYDYDHEIFNKQVESDLLDVEIALMNLNQEFERSRTDLFKEEIEDLNDTVQRMRKTFEKFY